MHIRIKEASKYDTGVHPEVTHIYFSRTYDGGFFEGDRFPNVIMIDCSSGRNNRPYGCIEELKLNYAHLQELNCLRSLLKKLELNCPSLRKICCSSTRLKTLQLNCPSLQKLECACTGMETLILNCPSLHYLRCGENHLRKMELNCPSLQVLDCHCNELTELELFFPFLCSLMCGGNYFTEIVGIEFCCDLEYLEAPYSTEAFLENFKTLLLNAEFSYWR